MQFTHKLSRRLALSRRLTLVTSLALLAACESDGTGDLGPLDPASPGRAGHTTAGSDGYLFLARGRKYRITEVTVSPASALLAPSAKQVFTAQGKLKDGSSIDLPVTWEAVGGDIDQSGVYQAPSTTGSFRVVAVVDNGLSDTAKVAVADSGSTSALRQVLISPANVSLQPGASQGFTVSGVMSDGSTAPVQVTYQATGGTVTTEGLYTAASTAGTYRLIATAADGMADTASVTVVSDSPIVRQVVLTPSLISLAPGGTQQFAASARLSDGTTSAIPVVYSATGGTISPDGLYTAGSSVGSWRVVAIQQEGSLADTAVVSIATPSGDGTPAGRADGLVETISVQTHLGYNNVYSSGWSSIIRPRLLELGVRHIRERMSTNATVISRFRDLGANGIRLTAGCWPKNGNYADASHCITQANVIGPAVIDAFDGWNEVDGGKAGPDWATAWVQWQGTLWQTYKQDATWSSRPLYANSLAHANSADQLGNRSSILDYGNLHSYPAAGLPSNISNSWIPEWTQVAGSKPLVVTETGYHTCPTCTNGNGVSYLAQSKYLGRLVFEYYNRNIKRTNIYELIDQGVSSTDREKNWGLIRNDGSVKPSFTTLKNIITLLKDPGAGFTPGRLSYRLSGALGSTHQTLLQKRDGRFYLVLWQELSVWNISSKSDVKNSDDDVSLTLGSPASAIRVYRPSGGLNPVQSGSGISLTLAVPDEVVVVEIAP